MKFIRSRASIWKDLKIKSILILLFKRMESESSLQRPRKSKLLRILSQSNSAEAETSRSNSLENIGLKKKQAQDHQSDIPATVKLSIYILKKKHD